MKSACASKSNVTLDRLRGIKTGQSIIYYRGSHVEDIERSREEERKPHGLSKAYGDLLAEIHDGARELAALGMVTLSRRDISKSVSHTQRGKMQAVTVRFVEYIATGIAG